MSPRDASQQASAKGGGPDLPEPFGALKVFDLAPVMVVRFEDGWSVADMRAAYERVISIGPPRFVLITDTQMVRPVGALERQKVSELLQALHNRLDPRVIVSIIVTDSALMRGVARAVLWFVNTSRKIVTAASMTEAYDEVAQYAAREGLILPSTLATRMKAIARPGAR
jgi:hypothetical protein